MKNKTAIILLHWKYFSEEARLIFKQALKKLGVYMYLAPSSKGQDSYLFILSQNKLTPKQIKEIAN